MTELYDRVVWLDNYLLSEVKVDLHWIYLGHMDGKEAESNDFFINDCLIFTLGIGTVGNKKVGTAMSNVIYYDPDQISYCTDYPSW